MKILLILLKREFKLFWANKVLVLLFLGAPIFYGVLLGYVYKKGKVTDLPIIVIDQDESILSYKIREMFEDNEVITTAEVLPSITNLHERFLEKDAACAVIIPKGFQRDVYTKKYPEITTIVNAANVLTANYSSSAVNRVLSTLKAGIEIETLTKKGIPKSIAYKEYEPFKTTYIKKNNRATNYMYFLWPGVLGTVLQQVLLLGLALAFASEFENKTFSALVAKSKSTIVLLIAKILPYLIMSAGIWVCYILFALWFKMPLSNAILPLTVITGLFVLVVSFLGVLVSIVLPSQLKATEVLMVVATPSFILSGFTWPMSQMPTLIQFVAKMIPSTHYLKIVRVLLVEKGSLYQVKDSLCSLVFIGVICALASFVVLHNKIKHLSFYYK